MAIVESKASDNRTKTGPQKNYAQVSLATGENDGPDDDTARKIQQSKLSREAREGVAGNKEKPIDYDLRGKSASDYATSKKLPSYKKGGMIRKTGLAKVHKGERMIPKAKVAKVNKLMKQKKG